MIQIFQEVWSGSTITWYLASAIVLLSLTSLFGRKSQGEKKVKNPPPGPSGYPVVGTFPSFLHAPAHIVFQEWAKKYGNVFLYKLGSGETVVLGDRETIKEAFISNSPDVDSRCQWRDCFITMFRGLSVLPYSEKWQNTRRRTVTILRDMGMGKSFMEDQINEENKDLINCMLVTGNGGTLNFHPRDMLRRAPMNTIYSIMFGQRYDYRNPKLLQLMDNIAYLTDTLAIASISDILPAPLRVLAGFSMKQFRAKLNELSSSMREKVEEHKKSYRKTANGNFVDTWLRMSDREETRHDLSIKKPISELPNVIQDVMIAGAHSTGLVFHWFALLMVLHKEEQDLAYQEIIEVLGADQLPRMSDRAKLPRVEAVVNETLRIGTVLPLVAHAALQDTVIGGYDVKKGTEVIYNNWAINRDENYFPEPDKFKPSRWLNEEGKIRKELLSMYYPFGIGKRACAGEGLAKMEIFITMASLIQNLEMLPPDNTANPSMLPEIKHVVGLLADCKPFLMRAKRRPNSLI